MVTTAQPRYEFRIFGNNLDGIENRIKELAKEEKTRQMTSVYLLASGNPKNNIKIREGVMDIKVLEHVQDGLEQWNPFLVGEFPLKANVIKTVVFPSLGVQSPVLAREEYTLEQFIEELISVDPDLSVAWVNKTRHAFTVRECITEIAGNQRSFDRIKKQETRAKTQKMTTHDHCMTPEGQMTTA